MRNVKRKYTSRVKSDRWNIALILFKMLPAEMHQACVVPHFSSALNHKGQEDLDTSRFLHKVSPRLSANLQWLTFCNGIHFGNVTLTNGPQCREPK